MKEALSELLNIKNLSLAQSAGSNGLQIAKFHEYILQHAIDNDDIVLWQITSASRKFTRVYPHLHTLKQVEEIQKNIFDPMNRYHYIKNSFNVFDQVSRIDLLCNSPGNSSEDIAQELQNLLTNIILFSKIYPKLLVMFGWSQWLNQYKKVFVQQLSKHNVNYVKEFYLDWVIHNRLDLSDDNHPSESAGREYAVKILYPKISSLGWTDGNSK
jgi:hypothetical protein